MKNIDYYIRDLTHYIIVFGLLSFTWVGVMYLTNILPLVWFINFILFIIFDKIAHMLLKLR